jgi:hypothetical protein
LSGLTLRVMARRTTPAVTHLGSSGTGFVADHWQINMGAAVNRLLFSARESPITQKTTQHALGPMFCHRSLRSDIRACLRSHASEKHDDRARPHPVYGA